MISVLVRTCNDARYLERVLTALSTQKVPDAVEIIVCNDHSTDGTAEILARFPEVRCIPPPPGRYVPGRTLNHLVRAARGEFIVFNNGDAIPQHDDFLAQLLAPLRAHQADAVFGNQLPRPDAQELVKKDYYRAFGDGKISAHWPKFFSLVASGFRRDTLLSEPFDETFQYSEDVQWVYRQDVSVTYVSAAQVEHSHNYTGEELRRRFAGEGRADRQMGKTPVNLYWLIRSLAAEILRDEIYLWKRGKYRELITPFRYRWTQKYSYYRGMHQ